MSKTHDQSTKSHYSPNRPQFSKEGDFLYFTAGDNARVKVFVLPIPPTPSKSTTHPKLPPKFTSPVVISEDGAASGLQTLPWGKLIFTKSSLTSPNDVFHIMGLKELHTAIEQTDEPVKFQGKIEQITRFTADELKDKKLGAGEDFWFKGGDDNDVHGYFIKPKGWKEGEKKKWPVVLLIHGGESINWIVDSVLDKRILMPCFFQAPRVLGRISGRLVGTRMVSSLASIVGFHSLIDGLTRTVFAQQGYFTVFINPTGSTTFGQSTSWSSSVTGQL